MLFASFNPVSGDYISLPIPHMALSDEVEGR